jgi:aminoglycoside/choline kinase family phosphotransferase
MALDMTPPDSARPFVDAHGWSDAEIVPLAGDASPRKYFRVVAPDRVAVLMDATQEKEALTPFIRMAEWLVANGFSAPHILARDLDAGLLLIEDLGSVRMRETVDADLSLEREIYSGITDVLVELHRYTPPSGLHTHGLAQWLDEVGLFTEWYGPAVGLDLDAASFRAAWEAVLTPIDAQGQNVAELRDFHAENVMLVEGKSGLDRFGLLDFQDALVGHPAYDLVSMLEDARRDVTPAIEAEMLARYIAAAKPVPGFEDAYWALGAQRNTRILGVFVRLWKRDGKPGYRQFQPRMWGLLERDLAHPVNAPLKAWFDAHVPPEKRAPFWAEFAA